MRRSARRVRFVAGSGALALAAALSGCGTKQVVLPVDTNGVVWTRITNSASVINPLGPDWRGDSIVVQNFRYYDATHGSDRIATMRADGSELTYVPGPPLAFTSDQRPKWVNDSILVFTTNRVTGAYDIFYRNLRTGVVRALTNFPGNEFDPDPQPGRPGLVFTDGPGRFQGRIAVIPDTAGVPLNVRYLTPDSLTSGEPDWDPTGTRLCFSADSADGSRHVWLATLTPGDTTLTQLTTGPFQDFTPRWMPDGLRIVFTSNRTGRSGLWWVSEAGEGAGLNVVAFEDAGASMFTPAVSPDGTKIVVSSDGRGFGSSLWVLSNFHF
ncbi:MAG TPA: hypothetical protein VF363_05305 [Candidatus Eisenbacteria bacterium]